MAAGVEPARHGETIVTEQLPVPVSRKTAITKERATPQVVVPLLILPVSVGTVLRP